MLSEDHDKTRQKLTCHVCHTQAFCRPLLPAVLFRKLTNDSHRGVKESPYRGDGLGSSLMTKNFVDLLL